jgi:hypothetical protein
LGKQQGDATQHRHAGKRHDKRRNPFVGNKPALRTTNDRAKNYETEYYNRPGQHRTQRDRGQRIDKRYRRPY